MKINNFSTLAMLALALLFSACGKEKKEQTSPSFVNSVEFNGEKIPVTIYYSAITSEENGEHSRLDSLTFSYGGKKHRASLYIPESSLLFWSMEPESFSHLSFDDYNFDGYMDINIVSPLKSGVSNIRSEIFMHNPKTESYYHHKELSEMDYVWIDSDTKTVKSHGKGGHAGMIYGFREYKWEKEKLTMIQSVDQDYNDALEKYIRITKTLKNGEWTQQTDTIYGAYDAEPLIDARDGQKYRTVEISKKTWMAQNLNNASKGGKCYEDKPENCEKYGRLYTWEEAMKACPEGWHLPGDGEWEALTVYIEKRTAGTKLKAKGGWNDYEGKPGNGTDEYGFSALPGGYGSSDGGFSSAGGFGFWWSINESNNDESGGQLMSYESEDVLWDSGTTGLYSVRCVKD